jgi:hypothetical protein
LSAPNNLSLAQYKTFLHLIDVSVAKPMPRNTNNRESANGRFVPVADGSSDQQLPQNPVKIAVNHDHDLSWMQANRCEEVEETPLAESSEEKEEKAQKIWDAIEERQAEEGVSRLQASD